MHNVLPRQTRARSENDGAETNERISAYAGRLKELATPTEVVLPANNDLAVALPSTEADVFGSAPEGNPDNDLALVLPMTIVVGSSSFMALQEWEGYVTKVDATTFSAELVDISGRKRHETEAAEFLLSDLEEDDRVDVTEGAVFRWVIGYQRRGGTRQRVSEIYLRRLPLRSASEIETTTQRSEELIESLGLR